MDKKIEKKKMPLWKMIAYGSGGVLGIVIIVFLLTGAGTGRMRIERDRITISDVVKDDFLDYITFSGNIEPIRTLYIDATEGGRVEDILVQEGQMVKQGDVLLKLSNTDLHLNILSREAALAEQMNNLRNTRLTMAQQKLSIKSQIIELENILNTKRRRFEKNKELFERELISEEAFITEKQELDYLEKKMNLLTESQKQDSIFREVQVSQLEGSVSRMNQNLNLVREKLENLDVKTEIDGQVVAINAELGEVKSPQQRLAQINDLRSYKLSGRIPEHYVSRIHQGLAGTIEYNDTSYTLDITSIHPQVTNNTFEVEMKFSENTPANLRIGQSFRVHLELGSPREAVLVSRGPYFQTTGGQWIYVLDKSGKYATRRDIETGFQNPDYYEIVSGLKEGEQVITSSYDIFGDAQRIIIK